jgi:hypothetical protein
VEGRPLFIEGGSIASTTITALDLEEAAEDADGVKEWAMRKERVNYDCSSTGRRTEIG